MNVPRATATPSAPAIDPGYRHPMPRVLLTSVFRPFCVEGPFDSALDQVQHGSCHRQFTREQGIFTIHQQCTHLGLHLIAANLDAETDVVEFPDLDELRDLLARAVARGRPYDWVGVSTTASFLPKARRICDLVREVSPASRTVVGGGGALAVGELEPPFADRTCTGDGVAFMRELLDQDPTSPIEHPVLWSVAFPNEIFGFRGHTAAYSIAVGLGCSRACDFCATSAQFGGRVPILPTAEAILAVMRRARGQLQAQGRDEPELQFLLFDENFLLDHALARRFRELNREELRRGRAYLPFVFADARSVLRFTPEELLEMGVDALWVGMETRDGGYAKNRGVDFAELVRRYQSHGIKVFLSFVAGLPDQTRAEIEADVARTLEIGAVGYQYAMCIPMPGTPLYARLRDEGRLDLSRPAHVNMGHYIVDHPELDDPTLRRITQDFHRDDHARHGPMALRFIRLRLQGWRRHRDSAEPALRTRARGFRNDILNAAPVLSIGPTFAPSPEVRALFEQVMAEVREEIGLGQAFRDAVRGRTTFGSAGRFLFFTHPLLEPVARRWLVARCLRWDPRSRERCATLAGLLRHRHACIREVGQGMMPFDQPVMVITRYPRERERAPAPRRALDRLRHRWSRHNPFQRGPSAGRA